MPSDIPKTVAALADLGAEIFSASVPGCFITDLIAAGRIPDLLYSDNILLARKLENLHIFYFTELTASEGEYLHFEGIDTIADIYVNGSLEGTSDNMFLPVDVYPEWKSGANSLVVHIKPVCIEARKYKLPVSSLAPHYTQEGLYIRKPAHSFGWDIMPRILTAGIYKPAELRKIKTDSIDDVFIVTGGEIKPGSRRVRAYFQFTLSKDFSRDYSVKISGRCKESYFEKESAVWYTSHSFSIDIEDAELWYPRNYGEQNLYDVTVTLYYKEEKVDEYKMSYGIRTAEIQRDDDTFKFIINGKEIFTIGTNWVPTTPYYHEKPEKLAPALDLLYESGANIVRIWGGGAYEDDEFYDFCDRHGILVWQDFMMSCAIYPQDREFSAMIEREAEHQIKRLRNHPSLVLWCGDNECDIAMAGWSDFSRAPSDNILTRRVLPDILKAHDHTRPYISSSPYIDKGRTQYGVSERHLWTRTEHFAAPFYLGTNVNFISEIGYSAFPDASSLKRFLKNPDRILLEDGSATDEYILHGTAPDTKKGAWYDHKVPCACKFASMVFSPLSDDLERLTLQSQYTQAEAYKAWVENAKVKGLCGIMLWNLLDGWPQVSEAMVDYYLNKKKSFDFVKRASRSSGIVITPDKKGTLFCYAVNKSAAKADIYYKILFDGNVLKEGNVSLGDNEVILLGKLKTNGESNFYKIVCCINGEELISHYQEEPRGLDLDTYIANIKETYGD